MKILFCLLTFIIALTASAQDFVDGTADIPLMAGLESIEDQTLVFDKATGKIVKSVATGEIPQHTVMHFYQTTLPQLGWIEQPAQTKQDLIFTREDEVLILEFRAHDEMVLVWFNVFPK